MRTTLAVLVAIGACTPVPSPTGTHLSGTILFSSPGPRSSDIWALSLGTSPPVRITTTRRSDEFDPAWSPDGSMIAFARRSPNSTSSNLWIVDSGGGPARAVSPDVDGPDDRQPAWSPDGSQIAWVRSLGAPSYSELWVWDVEEEKGRRLLLATSGQHHTAPSWSPDGSRLAFSSDRDGGFPNIYSIHADGSGRRRLTDGGMMDGNPVWSPDASHLAFERWRPGGGSDIWLVRSDGSGQRPLTRSAGNEVDPEWSPDGNHLVFTRIPPSGGRKGLFAIDLDSRVSAPLTRGTTTELAPAWAGMGVPGPIEFPKRSSSPPPPRYPDSFDAIRWEAVTTGMRLAHFRLEGSDVFALKVDVQGHPSIDVALADRGGSNWAITSRIAERNGAIAAVNGDFPHASGKPVHPFAEDGELKTTSEYPSRSLALSWNGQETFIGRPVEHLVVHETDGGGSWAFERMNAGHPTAHEIAGYSDWGARYGDPPGFACGARLDPSGPRPWVDAKQGVSQVFEVDAVRCSKEPLPVLDGVVLAAMPTTAGATILTSLHRGERLVVSWSLGWPGVVDSIGGFPLLVRKGRVLAQNCVGVLCGPHPRTGVGATANGDILLVVADGRQDQSRGLTLTQFGRAFRRLGAVDALNLDGGASTTMVVRGEVVNRPSYGRERPVSSAVLVLPRSEASDNPTPRS